jgi:hypothetical protein
MSSTASILIFGSQQYTVCVSFFILVAGIVGNLVNIIVFTGLRLFRENPCAFILTVESLINLSQLIISFIPRVWINAFANDLTQSSLLWCKLRPAMGQALSLISFYTMCLATGDQVLSTSHQYSFRRLSTFKLARQYILMNVVIWVLHGIPTLVFFEIQSSLGCSIYNTFYALYYSIGYFCILLGFLPMSIMSIFSVLAFRNVRKIVRSRVRLERRRLDRQLTAMVLIRVTFLVPLTLPYVIHYAYTFSRKNRDSFQLALDQFIAAITISFAYLHYSVSLSY